MQCWHSDINSPSIGRCVHLFMDGAEPVFGNCAEPDSYTNCNCHLFTYRWCTWMHAGYRVHNYSDCYPCTYRHRKQ